MHEDRKKSSYTRGRWQVMRERCHIDEETPPPDPRPVMSLGSILPALIQGLHLEEKDWRDDLLAQWEGIVGAKIASKARPGRINSKNLTVFCSSSSWLNELSRFGAKKMLADLQARFGSGRIASVSFQLDPEKT